MTSYCQDLSLSWASTADFWTGLTSLCCTANLQEQSEAVQEYDHPWQSAIGMTMTWGTLARGTLEQVTCEAVPSMEGCQAEGTSCYISGCPGSLFSKVVWTYPVTHAEKQPATDWKGEPLTSFSISPNLICGSFWSVSFYLPEMVQHIEGQVIKILSLRERQKTVGNLLSFFLLLDWYT